MRSTALLVALAAGCDPVAGEWIGRCEIESDDSWLALRLELDRTGAGDLEGRIELAALSLIVAGDVEGDSDGRTVALAGTVEANDVGWATYDLELNGSSVDGWLEADVALTPQGPAKPVALACEAARR